MTFRFIHTADWQLAKVFAQFPADVASELSAARLAVIRRTAAVAREKGASHILVAGDVFDTDRLSSLELRRVLEHMRAEQDAVFVLLPGNHDAARPSGIWERIASIGAPPNVTCCISRAPLLIDGERVAILPAPLTHRAPGDDPTAHLDQMPTPQGVMRIGLAHGSVQGFGSSGESAVMIARDRAQRAGLAYLALGDWHGMKCIDARTWYSGTPEPDRFLANDPGYILAVTLEGGNLPEVEPVRCGTFVWREIAAAIASTQDLSDLEAQIHGGATDPRNLILRLAISGALTLSEIGQLEAWREALASRVRYLDADISALSISAGAGDLDVFGADGALREAAGKLAALAEPGETGEARIARLALQRLASFAAEVQGGER